MQADLRRGFSRLGKALGDIVVGQRQHIHALRMGTLHQLCRAQGAVGDIAMAMQIVMKIRLLFRL